MHIILIVLLSLIIVLLAILIVPLSYKLDCHFLHEEYKFNAVTKLLFGFIKIKFINEEHKPLLKIYICGIQVHSKILGVKKQVEKRKKNENKKSGFPGFSFIKKFKNYLKDIINIIKPKIFTIYGVYGFDDPSVTGAICTVLAVTKPFISSCRINLNPVFDDDTLDIKVHISGSFSTITIIFKTLRFIFKKEIRKVIFKKDHKAKKTKKTIIKNHKKVETI